MVGIISSNLGVEERLLLWVRGNTPHRSGWGSGVSGIKLIVVRGRDRSARAIDADNFMEFTIGTQKIWCTGWYTALRAVRRAVMIFFCDTQPGSETFEGSALRTLAGGSPRGMGIHWVFLHRERTRSVLGSMTC